MTEPPGSERLSNGWHGINLSPPTGTRGSGSPWIPCAISASWRRFGTRAMRPGSAGDDDQPIGQRGYRPNGGSVGIPYVADAVFSAPDRTFRPDPRNDHAAFAYERVCAPPRNDATRRH